MSIPLDGFLIFSLFEFFTFFAILNALRYRKYGKFIMIGSEVPVDVYTRNSAIAYLVFIFIFINICALLAMRFWGFIFSILWIAFSSSFLYWYWHTKEDPFHHEQKIWEDPREKKQETK